MAKAKKSPTVFDLLLADAAKWVARPHDKDFPDESWEIVIPQGRRGDIIVAGSVTAEMVPAFMAMPAMLAGCKEVLRRWTFDGNQQHTHTWHDMQDCAALLRAAIAKAEGKVSP